MARYKFENDPSAKCYWEVWTNNSPLPTVRLARYINRTFAVRLCTRLKNRGYDVVVRKYEPKMVEKTNLLSGKKFTQREDTPLCCDPSSETYWSM